MEDAHIASINLGNAPDAAIFGVFDGHGGSEVAKFCQKYLAAEITRLEKYHQGNLPDSLVEVFHRMDSMLKDTHYTAELDALRQTTHDAAASEMQSNAQNHADQGEEDGQVSTSEALDMLRQVLMMRRKQESGEGDSEPQPMVEDFAQNRPDNSGVGEKQCLASANPPAAIAQRQPAVTATPTAAQIAASKEPAPGQPLSVDIPSKDSLPEHHIQAGCTAVVAVVKGNELWVANAGDSRAVLCRGGQALALSEDHKPQSETERNRITAAGGFVSDVGGVSRVNGNLNLSRAIGDLKYKGNEKLAPAEQIITAQPDIVKVELRSEDRFFVLACDGVWDVMSNQEVVQFVSVCLDSGMTLDSIASQLLDACLAPDPRETRGIGCDNMTCCIVLINPEATAASLPPLTTSSSDHSSATTGLLSQRNSDQSPKAGAGQLKAPLSGDDLPPPPGLNMPPQATSVP
ncbi:g12230 [Coccomyxa viridis]|uniref:protein-serine/threonine phosphatase n=1 Tax=Coccomyxa viridis TaxID=1274662 RepID=A0ABP1G9V2_9CHLO